MTERDRTAAASPSNDGARQPQEPSVPVQPGLDIHDKTEGAAQDRARRVREIRARLDAWRENCGESGGDEDLIAIFECHAADDVVWLLDQLAPVPVQPEAGEWRESTLRSALMDCLDVVQPLRDELRKQGRDDAATCCDEVIAYSREAMAGKETTVNKYDEGWGAGYIEGRALMRKELEALRSASLRETAPAETTEWRCKMCMMSGTEERCASCGGPMAQLPAIASSPAPLNYPTLKYTVARDRPCAVCRVTLRAGDLCYRDVEPETFRHISHGPASPAPPETQP